MPKKIYGIKKEIDKKTKEKLKDYDNLTSQLLFNRGIKNKEEAKIFLEPDFVNHLHNPFLLKDMDLASDRIIKAIKNNERIGVWSDYDADGIPGGALLHDFFKKIGFTNFINYIPNRHSEGYGLNKEGIEELAKPEKGDGVKLLITIDCGIRDNEEILHAKNLGIDTIITDHHEPESKESKNGKPIQELPDAYAIVNPKRHDSKYPEKILCGTGVVWKLIEAILKKERDFMKEGQEKWLLDLVGIATLSDMVPLTGENRALAYFGLSVLRKTKRVGLNKLFSHLRINKSHLNEDDIGFLVTPRINAASRMGHPKDAFDLLVAENEAEADICVRHLDNINNERKGMVASISKEAKKMLKEKLQNFGEKSIIVLGNPDWRPALLGLAANSIAEEFNRPVFLWGRENGDVIKGSCRSDGVVDLVEIMERSKNIFIEFGGHKFSGGFSIEFENVHILEETLIEASTHATSNEQNILVDKEMNIKEVNEETVSKILKLSPFGVGNEKPIFIFKNIIPEKINRFGKNKEHLSIIFRDGNYTTKAISFFTHPDQFGEKLKEGIKTNVVANIEKSFYNGSSEIRLRIIDFF